VPRLTLSYLANGAALMALPRFFAPRLMAEAQAERYADRFENMNAGSSRADCGPSDKSTYRTDPAPSRFVQESTNRARAAFPCGPET
jgi:hypothetical protein